MIGPAPDSRSTGPALLTYFLATFGVTWTCWMAAAAIRRENASDAHGLAVLSGALLLLGTLAPGLIGLALTEIRDGRAAPLLLVGRVFPRGGGCAWYGA